MARQRRHLRRIRGKYYSAGRKPISFDMEFFEDRGYLKARMLKFQKGIGGGGKIIVIRKLRVI